MKELFKSLRRHQFFTLSSGVVGAQILSLCFMPILTRLYPVESFGYFAIYIATANLIGVFSTLRLELTIPIAQNDQEANQLSSLTCTSALVAGLFAAAVFSFPQVRGLLPSMVQDESIWLMIAFSAILIGWIQTISQRILRNGKLKFVAIRHIIDKGSFIVLALVFAKLDFTVSGLIIAQTVGNLLSVVVLYCGAAWLPSVSFSKAKALAKKYSDFPKLNTTSMALQLASSQLPTLLYSSFFPVQAIGYLNLAQRLAEAPNTIVTSALGTVYYRRILNASRDQYRRIYLRTLLWSVIVFFIPAFVFSFYAEPVIKFIFGVKWEQSVPFFLALLPLTVARLSFMLQQGLPIVLRRLDLDLKISALVLFGQAVGLVVGIYLSSSLLGPVTMSSIFTAMIYLVSLGMLYRLITEPQPT